MHTKVENPKVIPEADKINPRRIFLGAVGNTAVALTIAANTNIIYEVLQLKNKENKIKRQVLLPGGEKVGLVLGIHGYEEIPGEDNISAEDYFSPVGAVFSEIVWDWQQKDIIDRIYQGINRKIEFPPFFQGAINLARNKKTPLVFGDINFIETEKYIEMAKIPDLSSSIGLLMTTLGNLGLIVEQYLPKKVTRREFLKLATFGVPSTFIGIGLVLQGETLINFGQKIGVLPDSDAMRDLSAIFANLIHPNDYVVVMRNIIWALKIHDLYNQGIVPKYQIINILGGTYHKYVEFFLKYPDVAVNYFQMFNYKDWINDKAIPSSAYRSLICQKGQPPKIIEHQTLRKLMR